MPSLGPTFNLVCGIYTGPYVARAHRLDSPCNLAYGRRVSYNTVESAGNNDPISRVTPLLLLPALTDVRGTFQGVGWDIVECPAGSGRWYQVYSIEDSGKGFPNEHRVAGLFQACESYDITDWAGLFWPIPMP